MASNLAATLSPYDVTAVIVKDNVTHTISGYSEDQMLTVTQNMPRFETYTGADNTNTLIHKNNTSATVTFSLTRSSNSNDILTWLHKNHVSVRDSSGLFTIVIKDNSGRTLFSSYQAFIAALPDISFANSMTLNEWVISALNVDTFIAGNAKLDPADAQAIEQMGGTVDDFWRA